MKPSYLLLAFCLLLLGNGLVLDFGAHSKPSVELTCDTAAAGAAPEPDSGGTEEGEELERLRRLLAEQRATAATEAPELAKTLSNLSFALWKRGLTAESRNRAHEALQLLDGVPEAEAARALVKSHLVRAAESEGQLEEALQWSLEACEDLTAAYGKSPMAGEAHEETARLLAGLGRFDEAQRQLEWAIAIYERWMGPFHEQTARPMAALAELLHSRSQSDVAFLLRRHALSILGIAGESSSELEYALYIQQLAQLRRLGEREDILLLLGDEETDPTDLESLSSFELERILLRAEISVAAGHYERALSSYRKLLEIGEGLAVWTPEVRFRLLVGRARARVGLGDLDVALEIVSRARTWPNAPEETHSFLQLLGGHILIASGRLNRAYEILREALETQRTAIGEDHPALLATLLALLECEFRTHGLSPETLDLLDMIDRCLVSASPDQVAELDFEQRGLWHRTWDGILQEAWLVAAQKRPRMRQTAYRALDLIQIRKLHSVSTSASALPQTRSRLRGDRAALLRIYWTADRVWAWWLGSSEENDRLQPLGSIEDLAPLVEDALRACLNPAEPWHPDELAKHLFEPIQSELASSEQLRLIADGPVAFLPIEALPFQGRPLVFHCALSYGVPGEPHGVRAKLKEDRATPAHAKATQKSRSCVYLHGTTTHPQACGVHQLERLRRRWGDLLPERTESPKQLQQVEAVHPATEERLRALSRDGALANRSAVVLAVPLPVDTLVPSATGFLLDPPKPSTEPAWRREDGMLMPAELAELDLSTSSILLPNTEILISAKEQDVRAEGLLTVVAGLLSAGARQVGLGLRHIRPVEDQASTFHRKAMEMLAGGCGADELASLQREWLSRADARNEPESAHPTAWCGFRLFIP